MYELYHWTVLIGVYSSYEEAVEAARTHGLINYEIQKR